MRRQGAVPGITVENGQAISVVGPKACDFFRLVIMLGAVELEAVGIRSVRRSITAQAKREYGIKGNRDAVITFLKAEVERQKFLQNAS